MKRNATFTFAAILVASCFSLSADAQTPPKSAPAPHAAPAPRPAPVRPAASAPAQSHQAPATTNSRPAGHNPTPQTQTHTPTTPQAGHNPPTQQGGHTPATQQTTHSNSTPQSNGRGPTPNNSHTTGAGEQRGTTHTTGNERPGNNDRNMGRSGGSGPAIPHGARSVPFNGGTKVVRSDGSLHSVQSHGYTVTHGPNGMRNVVHDRQDGSRVFVNRAGGGYVQRPFAYRGNSYVSRTYVVNHVSSVRYYRQYAFRPGLTLAIYAPHAYYSPGFYGWAYHPWGPAIAFSWGWAGSPWYGYYGSWYSPYPMYSSAVPWLTDYLISASLADAYAQRDPNGPPPSGPGLSPQVKDYIGQEVQRQLMLANAEGQTQQRGADIDPGSSSIARVLGDGQTHVFVAHAGLDLVDNGGNECALSEGDAVQFTPPASAGAGAVNVQVLWSRGQDCRIGSTVSLGLDNLQEMQNYMRATVDTALADLKSKQGHDGIPSAPAVANTNPVPATYAPLAPPPDPNANAALKDELGAADQVEKDANAH